LGGSERVSEREIGIKKDENEKERTIERERKNR